jgi:hypothetical protein
VIKDRERERDGETGWVGGEFELFEESVNGFCYGLFPELGRNVRGLSG